MWANILLATPVDLSTFVAETGVVESSGVVTFTEADTSFSAFYFYHPAFYVEPSATKLTFDYSFTVCPENDDWLVAVINFTDYKKEFGGYNSSTTDDLIFSGSWTIDMTPYQGSVIDLAFGFEANDWGYDSYGTISNINIQTSSSVPEPGTMIFLGTGLAGLFCIGRRKFLKNL